MPHEPILPARRRGRVLTAFDARGIGGVKPAVAVALGALVCVAALTVLAFQRDLAEAQRHTQGRSEVTETSFGRLEYAVVGSGPAMLMIHGTGGGFDQALTFTEKLIGRGHRVIAPSRFGYLRSDFPDDPSSERQADAFAQLLDRLGIERVAVAGGSAGALSAVQFTLRHPRRCSALVLIVPAANVRGTDPVEMTPMQQFLVRQMTTSNLLFWLGLKLQKDAMIETLLATDPAVVHNAPVIEQQRVDRILDEIMPVSLRSRGMLNDARLAGRPARVDFMKIAVPTLVISVEDDRFGTASTARDIAAAVPRSRLVIYPSGGHVWVGHDDEVWTEVSHFISKLDRAK